MADGGSSSTNPSLLRMLRSPFGEAAWRKFLAKYKPLIERWCLQSGLQAADVEDVTSCVLTNLVRAMREFELDPAHRFRGWLKTVVNNALRSFLRERKKHPANRTGDVPVDDMDVPGETGRLASEMDDRMSRDLELADEIIQRVQQRVEEQTWEAYWRTAIDDEPAGEVAASLGLNLTSVYVAKHRVAKMLRSEGIRLLEE
jgi:RNA polymerase sigma-70 factor (ECF subfamily)